MFEIRWSDTASESYNDEADFVFKKWGAEGMMMYYESINDFLNTLKSGTLVGKPSKKRDIRISVISKHISVAYKINEKDKVIYLVLFWGNSKNPDNYKSIIEK